MITGKELAAALDKAGAEVTAKLNKKIRRPCGCVVYEHSSRVVSMCWEHAHRLIGGKQ